MSAVLSEIVESWTGALPFTLKADDQPIDISGLRVAAVLRDNRGLVFDTSSSGRLSITSSTGGQLELLPSSSDFVAARSPYRLRFRITSQASGRSAFVPSDDASLILVGPI